HVRIESASRSASAESSTRKAMFPAQIGKDLGSGPGAARFHILISPADAFNGFVEILLLPGEIRGYRIVQRVSKGLAMLDGEFFQLGLPLRPDGNEVHLQRASMFVLSRVHHSAWESLRTEGRPFGEAKVRRIGGDSLCFEEQRFQFKETVC